MNESRLPHSILGSLLSWLLTVIAWGETHLGVLAGAFAVAASLYSIRASRETILLRRKQRDLLKEETDL